MSKRNIGRKIALRGPVVRQMDQGLVLAQQKYFEAVEAAAKGQVPQHGPWIVAENVTAALFEAWSGKQESRWKLAYQDRGGRVLLYGDPSKVHDNAAGHFSQMIVTELTVLAGRLGSKSIVESASPIQQLVNSRKEPDFSLTPRDCLQFTPTIVGEVAFRNETLSELKNELSRWTARDDLAQMCIGIHVNTARTARFGPYLTIWWKTFNSQHRFLHFGRNTRCTASGISTYMFKIPFDLLFARSDLADMYGDTSHVSVDLFDLRKLIQDTLVAYYS